MFKILTITGSGVAGVILSVAIAAYIPEGEARARVGFTALILPPAITTIGFLLSEIDWNNSQKKKSLFDNPQVQQSIIEIKQKLLNGEQIEHILLSVYLSKSSIFTKKDYWLTVATNTRVLTYKPTISGYQLSSLSYNKISMIEYKKAIFESIEIVTSVALKCEVASHFEDGRPRAAGEKLEIPAILEGDVNGLVQYVSSKI